MSMRGKGFRAVGRLGVSGKFDPWLGIQDNRSHFTVMSGRVMFRPVVGEILGAGSPEHVEMAHLDAILDPVKSHVDSSRSLLLANVVGDVVGCQIVSNHHGGRLRMAHLFQNRSDSTVLASGAPVCNRSRSGAQLVDRWQFCPLGEVHTSP